MRKILFITIGLVLIGVVAFAGMFGGDDSLAPYGIDDLEEFGTVGSGGEAAFCGGSELFCEDFEGADTTWDATGGAANADCALNSDGDYCDDEDSPVKYGSESFSIRGAYTNYVQEAFSSANQSTFYTDFWFYSADVASNYGSWQFYNENGSVLTIYITSGDRMRVYYNNDALYVDTGIDLSDSTWWHIRVYFIGETNSPDSDDARIYVWASTSDTDFDGDAADYDSTASLNAGNGSYNDADGISLWGPKAATVNVLDNIKVVSGAPS